MSAVTAEAGWALLTSKLLIETKACVDCIILNKADGTVWSSSSENFQCKAYVGDVMQEDGSEVKENIDEEKGLLEFAATFKKPKAGIRIAGSKFQLLRAFEKGTSEDGMPTMFLKKSKGGGCMCVTERAIVIGIWDEGAGQQASTCNDAVEKLSRYLKSLKF